MHYKIALVIEEDAQLAFTLKLFLEDWEHYVVFVVPTLDEAQCLQIIPDVVLYDVGISPNGMEHFEYIKKTNNWKHAILCTSGQYDPLLKYGHRILKKPFTLENIEEALKCM